MIKCYIATDDTTYKYGDIPELWQAIPGENQVIRSINGDCFKVESIEWHAIQRDGVFSVQPKLFLTRIDKVLQGTKI